MSSKQPAQGTFDRHHAVVIGASMAGLLAARVLSDHFAQVTIIERDRLTADAKARKGVPQGRHVHGWLARGAVIMREYFPDLFRNLAQDGAISEYARVPGDFLFRLPAGVDCKQAHVLSAGVTAAMGLRQLEKHDLTPQRGPVLVTGATGGVGSLAVSLLSRRGYTVAASTGKPDAQDYLRRLGASGTLSREETEVESMRPLETERWAGSIDNVGGATLAYLMRTTKKGGAIAAIGVAGGAAFRATVFPLILRGIKVLGIDMPSTPLQMRRELWKEVIHEATLLSLVDMIVSEVTLEDIPRVTQAMLGGQTRGRILVRPSEQ